MAIAIETRARQRRRFFFGMAIVCALAVLWGFGPTFFLRAFITTRELSWLIVIHGITFCAWIVLFVVQTLLVAKQRTGLHRRLGLAGIALGIAVVGLGTAVAVATLSPQARAAIEAAGPVAAAARLASGNVGNALMFGILFAAAVWLRRHAETHKRLMLAATIAVMDAPVARVLDEVGWPIVVGPFGFQAVDGYFNRILPPLLGPWQLNNLVVLPLFLALVVYDIAKNRRLHWATVAGGAVLFLFQPAAGWLARTLA
jgi:hypothetical protein